MGSLLDIGHRSGMAHGSVLYSAAGQILYSTGNGTTTVLAAPAAGASLYHTGTAPAWLAAGTGGQTLAYDGTSAPYWSSDKQLALAPTGAVAESMSRFADIGNVATTLVSQRVQITALALRKGQTVAALTWISGTTGLSAGVHQYGGLYTSAGSRVAVSADGTSGAWNSSTAKTFTFTAAYPVTATGLYYAALLIDATVPTLMAVNSTGGTSAIGIAPIINATADTGQTSLPTSLGATTAFAKIPYVYAT